jgi:hypothetical protein
MEQINLNLSFLFRLIIPTISVYNFHQKAYKFWILCWICRIQIVFFHTVAMLTYETIYRVQFEVIFMIFLHSASYMTTKATLVIANEEKLNN